MGRRLRALRLERGLQQSDVARRLGVSAAYLSLIEKGKRAVQVPLLFNALEIYGVPMEEFMASLGEARVDQGLARLLDEPLLRTLHLSRADLASLSAEPKVATTIAALFNLYKNTRGKLDHLLADLATRERDGTGGSVLAFDFSPFDEVTEFLEANGNYFPGLEERAEALRRDAELNGEQTTSPALEAVLREHLGIRLRYVPATDSSVIRRLDPEGTELSMSADIGDHRRKFQLAHAIGLRLIDDDPSVTEGILDGLSPRHVETGRLVKVHLANYLAGAILLPYGPFLRVVQHYRYDVDRIAQHFAVGYETVAHRLCNLSDPGRRGVPLHFLRVDVAGNISKRYAATGLRFPQGTGSCPKWAVHGAFLTPQAITRQYSEFPGGDRYFCFARVVADPRQGSLVRGTVYSIGLGTVAEEATHLAYGDDMPFADPGRMAIPVGISCRVCERTDCNQRAAPSYKFAFRVDEYTKKDNFFSPQVADDRPPPGDG